jgi:hypothetical protein
MIQNITSLFTSSSVVPMTTIQPIKNIPRIQPESSSESDSVKLTISPEARQALDRYEKYQSQHNGPVKESEANKYQSVETGDTASPSGNQADSSTELTPEEERIIQRLKQTDQDVRTHEQQHISAAGGYVKSGPVYNYTTGPDGKRYAVGGRVSLDMTPVPNNPEATIRKAQIIKKAALAPADPSGADRAVAATATRMEMKAREELRTKNETDGKEETNQKSDPKIKAYTQSNLQLGKTVNILF